MFESEYVFVLKCESDLFLRLSPGRLTRKVVNTSLTLEDSRNPKPYITLALECPDLLPSSYKKEPSLKGPYPGGPTIAPWDVGTHSGLPIEQHQNNH